MEMLRPRLVATVTGLPYSTVGDYLRHWPFLCWRCSPGVRADVFIPPAALPFLVLARQGFGAKLARAEIDALLLAAHFPGALVARRYPSVLVYSPATGDLRVNIASLDELRARTCNAAAHIDGDDLRPAALLFDVQGIAADCARRLESAEIEGEDRLTLGQQWAILATDAMLRAHEQFAAEVEARQGVPAPA